MILEGQEALAYAEANEMQVSKRAGPIEKERHNLTLEEARELDPKLIYIDVSEK